MGDGDPNVNMDGLKVFPMAVRQLYRAAQKQACGKPDRGGESGLHHPAPGQRTNFEAVDQRLKLPKRVVS